MDKQQELRMMINIILDKIKDTKLLKAVYRFAEKLLLREQ